MLGPEQLDQLLARMQPLAEVGQVSEQQPGFVRAEVRDELVPLPRLQPACLDDLVVAVSLIRPGPVQGQMVHPYLRRRAGEEPVRYLHPCLEPVLQSTLGVLLFQEQVLLVAQAAAGWSLGRGELLRRTLSKGDDAALAALRHTFRVDAMTRGIDTLTADYDPSQYAEAEILFG